MQLTRKTVWRAVAGLVVVLAILVGAYLAPLPSVGQIRTWADATGPAFVWAFFLAYALLTILPLPRTAFTVPAGVLFGPVVGFTGSMAASVFAALVAFVLVRRLGRARVEPYLKHAVVLALEQRLERRGWLAVGSLRLIAAVPFWLCNYVSALSSVRFLPYAAATVVGMAPGTAAVVFLGDALTGQTSPGMMALTAVLFSIGVLGLVIDAKLPARSGKS
ncbi:MAG: TVP38/TMEM64 family protein [Gordonia sp. (in: high G+C Gram-positive bacteria)]